MTADDASTRGGGVTVLFLGSLGEAVATEPIALRFAPGETVGDLRQRVIAGHPDVAATVAICMIAMDRAHVADEEPLRDGVEVAFLPPVSGG